MREGDTGEEGEKLLSSLARQINTAQLLSVSNDSRNLIDMKKMLSFSFLFYVGTVRKKKKKRLKNPSKRYTGNEH